MTGFSESLTVPARDASLRLLVRVRLALTYAVPRAGGGQTSAAKAALSASASQTHKLMFLVQVTGWAAGLMSPGQWRPLPTGKSVTVSDVILDARALEAFVRRCTLSNTEVPASYLRIALLLIQVVKFNAVSTLQNVEDTEESLRTAAAALRREPL